MKAKQGFAVREICGEFLLIPLGDNALTYSEMITTNEIGSTIWNFLQKDHTKEELVSYMLEQYDVEETLLRKDIDAFLDRMKELKLFEE